MFSSSTSSYKLGELILRKWQGLSSREKKKRSKGHFVVYAKGGKRFVVPLKYLDHPIFRVLLEMAEEEFGSMVCGPLRVPCEEEFMDHIVSLLRRNPNPKEEIMDHKALLSISSCRVGGPDSFFLLPSLHRALSRK